MTRPDRSERDLVAEVKAAAALVIRHRPAAVTFRLSADRDGRVRLVLDRIEGIPLAALAEEVESPGRGGA